MITLIVLMGLSLLAMCFYVLSRFEGVASMSEKEFLLNLKNSPTVSSDLNQHVIVPLLQFYHNIFLPWLYKEIEKIISRFRINVLKIETGLLRLTNYVRGKRKICMGENSSEYWKEMNEFKSELTKAK